MGKFHLILVNPANLWPTQSSCVARALPPCHSPPPLHGLGQVVLSHWLQEAPAIIQFLVGTALPSPDPILPLSSTLTLL